MKKLITFITALCASMAIVVIADDSKTEVELQGKLGCAHCNYSQKGESCGVGFKTADGKIYIIEDASKDLFKARMDGGEVKVKGVVTEKDGKLFVHASKAELVK